MHKSCLGLPARPPMICVCLFVTTPHPKGLMTSARSTPTFDEIAPSYKDPPRGNSPTVIPVNARARFRVYFCTVDSDESLQAWESGQERPSNRILVVDSEISIREFSAEVLTASGYQVDTADGGVAGWEALHMRSYDLLIIGCEMPQVSGVA